MTEKKSNGKNSLLLTAGIIAGTFIVVYALSVLFSDFFHQPMRGMRFLVEEMILLKAIASIVTTFLLAYVLYNYVSVYREIKSDFSLGLIVVVVALLAYSVTSNPFFVLLFGFRGSGLGPFTLIPAIFNLFAAVALTYLSSK